MLITLDLSIGTFLPAYKWNGGASWNGKPWSSHELPTDAQILIHLFCTFLDQNLPDFQKTGRVFSAKYFLSTMPKDGVPKGLKIFQKRIAPNPHFEIISTEGTVYAVQEGPRNLFTTLALFIYLIKTKYAGSLEMVPITYGTIKLSYVVEE